MSLIQSILTIINPAWELHYGMVPRDGRHAYVLAGRRKGHAARIISRGDNLSAFFPFVTPLPVHTDCGTMPVALLSELLDADQPEEWVDRNEERLRPHGMTADQVQIEWAVHEQRIVAATLTAKGLDTVCASLRGKRCLLASVAVPLWDLCRLYSQQLTTPFILWKCTAAGSLLGFAADGYLQRLCMLWPDQSDLREQPGVVAAEIAAISRSLCGGETATIIMMLAGNDQSPLPASFVIHGFTLSAPPSIDGVEPRFHEPYSLALHDETHLDFAPAPDTQACRALSRRRIAALKLVRLGTAAVVAIALAMGGIAAGFQIVRSVNQQKIEPAQREFVKLSQLNRTLDSLRLVFGNQAAYLDRKSAVTDLLVAFQSVFPEGVLAEQLFIGEKETRVWSIEIMALSYSTSQIATTLTNLNAVKGVGNVRMLYSEQVRPESAKSAPTAIRMKIAAEWRDR
jgi:hypothetical protein